jgi:hypothetical protein
METRAVSWPISAMVAANIQTQSAVPTRSIVVLKEQGAIYKWAPVIQLAVKSSC